MSSPLISFPGWLSAGLAAAQWIAVGGAGAALLWDWARVGRRAETRRCPKCWYDMRNAGLTCPECGRTAKQERELHRSRRRWVPAVLLLIAAAGCATARRVNGRSTRDLVRSMPTEALLAAVDDPCQTPGMGANWNYLDGDFRQTAGLELWERDIKGLLAPAQRRALARKQFQGAWAPTQVWVRPAWPRGVPVHAVVRSNFRGVRTRDLRACSGWPGAEAYTARAAADFSEFDRIVQMNASEWVIVPTPAYADPGEVVVDLGMPPEGATEASLEVTIREEDLEVWRGRVAAPIKLVDRLEDAIRPDATPEVTLAVEKAFREGFTFGEDFANAGVPPVAVEATDTAVAVRVEVVREGRVLASCSLVAGRSAEAPAADEYERYRQQERASQWSWAALDRPLTAELVRGATIRVTADPELALRATACGSYWLGTVEVPADGTRRSPLGRERF